MDKDLFKGVKIGTGIVLSLSLFFVIVYAAGFHSANEILNGVFTGDYSFNGSVNFTNSNVYGINTTNVSFNGGVLYVGNGPTTPDVYTTLLLHMDDASLSDTSSSSQSITLNGDASRSSNDSKFGGYSAYFDNNGDYIHIAPDTGFDFAGGDFTIDFWVKTLETGANNYLWDNAYTYSGNNINIGSDDLIHATAGFCGTPGCGWGVDLSTTTTINADQWYHVAFIRYGDNFSLYLDGNLEDSTIQSGSLAYHISQTGNLADIGKHDGDSFWPYGYVDEFRISKGIARWTSEFTPPTEAYAQVDTLYFRSSNGTITTLS